MEYQILGLVVALICLFHFGRKNAGWAFLVSFIIVALLNLVVLGVFVSGPEVGHNWGALPEVLASILGPFIVQFGVVYIVYYITSEFIRWVKNEPEIKSDQQLESIAKKKKVRDSVLTIIGLFGLFTFVIILIWKVATAK